MSIIRHLRLDEVVTSFPELGPTVPDGGYSWIILFGVFLIQITVPSVLSMYGIILGYLVESRGADFYLWQEKIILTPILFAAFWCIADPWTRMIVSMASVPRLVGLIGVALLSTGVIASGYLATGGVGAYLANSSAGAVMGIGASFIMLQSDYVLRKYFRKRLLLALTVRNIGTSAGLVFIPALTRMLLVHADLKTSLLSMTIVFFPTILGALTFRSPPQRASPYRLLLSTEDDNELPIRISPDITKNPQHQDDSSLENIGFEETEERADRGSLYNAGNNIYSYQEPEEEVDLFINPVPQSNSKLKVQLRVFRSLHFWAATVGWVGFKGSNLFFWILLPTLSVIRSTDVQPFDWASMSIIAGAATFLPNIISYKVLKSTRQCRRIFFGVASVLSAVTLIGLSYASDYTWILACSFLGGISIGSLSSCQNLAMYDVLGTEVARRAHKGFSTLAGVCILMFCFVHGIHFCLRLVAGLQFIGGLYWASSPVVKLIKNRGQTPTHSTN